MTLAGLHGDISVFYLHLFNAMEKRKHREVGDEINGKLFAYFGATYFVFSPLTLTPPRTTIVVTLLR